MSKLVPIIVGAGAGAFLLVAGAAYFGLSWYSGKEAEKRLEDWSYEVGLEDQLRWKSVSATPFGGKVTIKELEFGEGSDDALRIEKVVLSDLIAKNERTRMRLQLEGVDTTGVMQELRSVSPLGRYQNVSWFERAMFAEPSDLDLFIDIDDDSGTFKMAFASDAADLYASSYEFELSNQRGLNRTLLGLEDAFEDGEVNSYMLQAAFQKLAGSLERAEIESAHLQVKDRGLVARSVALYQRYNTPLDPRKGSADKQREAYYEKNVEDFVKKCETAEAGDLVEDLCENLGKVMLGKSKGLELSVDPSDPVRIGDLFKTGDARSVKRLVDRLNLEVDTL